MLLREIMEEAKNLTKAERYIYIELTKLISCCWWLLLWEQLNYGVLGEVKPTDNS